jgi:hypothetical protein
MAVPLTAAGARLLAQAPPAAPPEAQLRTRYFAALRQQMDAQRAALDEDDWDDEDDADD